MAAIICSSLASRFRVYVFVLLDDQFFSQQVRHLYLNDALLPRGLIYSSLLKTSVHKSRHPSCRVIKSTGACARAATTTTTTTLSLSCASALFLFLAEKQKRIHTLKRESELVVGYKNLLS
jgi:hypothetical protein